VSIELTGPAVPRGDEILTSEAIGFVAELQRRFRATRNELLADRIERRGSPLDFLAETKDIRESDWRVAPTPSDLQDRRVEITGPCDRKMTINALNSGARVWLADLEDASTPHWRNVVSSQVNLYDAIRRQIDFVGPEGKTYTLNDGPVATIVMRPRGWHLNENHLLVDGEPSVGALVDFGLFFFHNAKRLLDNGSGPYFYLPKLESHLEARLWNDVFAFSEEYVGVPEASVRATVLIETIPAAFEMDEILYELRDRASGLNAGRWDYLFSLIKWFRDAGSAYVLPDRASVTMTAPMMRTYAQLLVKTCHRRGAHAIGGMAAFIPSRRDEEVNALAFAKVRDDKEREAGDGFDGSWVAHPDLVPVCQEKFDAVLGDRPNQVDRLREDVTATAADLLDVGSVPGGVTGDGLRNNLEVALVYLEAWLGGTGAVGIHNLMEDAATAEIARSQVWQWVHNGTALEDGPVITKAMVLTILDEVEAGLRQSVGSTYDERRFDDARRVLELVALEDDFVEFLTLPAYEVAE